MVPCLHQCNVYIVRKLLVWRAQNFNFLVSAKTERTVVGQKTTPCLAAPYWASNRNFQNFGTTIVMVPYLHQCNVYIVWKVRVWRAQKFNLLVSSIAAPTGTGQQTTPCLAAPYWARNKNFQNFWSTYLHGTVFAPMQCLYCKEATGVESPEMQFTSLCKNCTDRYGSTNFPVSCSAESCQQ